MSFDELSERIIENNQDIKIETVSRHSKKKFLEGKKGNHISFFVNNTDYIDEKSKKRIICHKCTDTFFNIFFKDQKDENDEVMQEIFKSKVYMYYVPEEQIYRCPNNSNHIEILRDPQIEDKRDKKIIGAGMENYPEYVSYLDPDTVQGDFILTANIGKKNTMRSKKSFFKEETEDELFYRYMESGHS
jgi:hypothetical protein